jgi:hypothetical protein
MTTKIRPEVVIGIVVDELSSNFGAHILDIAWDGDDRHFVLTRGTQGLGMLKLSADDLHELGAELMKAADARRNAR